MKGPGIATWVAVLVTFGAVAVQVFVGQVRGLVRMNEDQPPAEDVLAEMVRPFDLLRGVELFFSGDRLALSGWWLHFGAMALVVAPATPSSSGASGA